MWAAQRADLFTHHSLGGAHVENKWRQMAQIQCMWAANIKSGPALFYAEALKWVTSMESCMMLQV